MLSEKDQELQRLRNEIREEQTQSPQIDEENTASESLQRLREEKEFAEGQINFLNSVIVDLQRKNEELKLKLKKMVLSEWNDEENNGLGEVKKKKKKKKKESPPRVFCDICDCFDLHDTEDCPTQTQQQQQSPGSPPHSVNHGKRSEERPYCEVCEAFGHATDSCNEDQTF
ncbi:hypothetical protein DNTS_001375 [Danionella cerebrum]|uniref:CLIP1 zinc knuckle domain-containing protein n=1 Tax=Danionella cerebrum TaxID=2873325 RepID=A0A553NKR0_9TELE|nr:hypothetical protein DNTS_001375 [Danionella translucida]